MAPNLMGVVFALGVVLAIPLLLGAVAVLLAGAEGAAAGPHLRAGRRLLAVAAGELVGGSALGGAALAGLDVAVSAGAGLAGCFLAIFVATVLGMLLAYRTARAVATRLGYYRCAGCRGWFRAPWPAERCPRCAEKKENPEVSWASEFATRLRELAGRAPADRGGTPGPSEPHRTGPPPAAPLPS
jgi:hypothetical protein